MSTLLTILSFTYAILMLGATIKGIPYSRYPLIYMINILGVIFIFFSLKDYHFLYMGISLLFIAAILNGYFVLGRLTFSHIAYRLAFSAILIYLNYRSHRG